jgi:hypothetical protein
MIDSQELRVYVYDLIIAHGQPPTSGQIAKRFDGDQAEALRALRDLKIGKTVLPHPQTGEIWMAGPFAASPTDYKVVGRSAHWWANCAWDMFGVAALVGEPVRIAARCTDCASPMTYQVDATDTSVQDDSLVHFLVPATHWYDDIGFT